MICFDRKELERLFHDDMHSATVERPLWEVIDTVRARILGDNTTTEIFAALSNFIDFYPTGSMLCFVLKESFDPNKTPIQTLTELKKAIRQDQEIDFGVLSKDKPSQSQLGLRQFQLKRYRGATNTDALFAFIERKLRHYGNSLGETNLLIILQLPGQSIDDIIFTELNRRLKELSIPYEGEILLIFNANNEFLIVKRVYPESGAAKIPLVLPSYK